MQIKRIVFYNKGHIGDLHLTRQYVSLFPKWFPMFEFVYLHPYRSEILGDIGIAHSDSKEMLEKLPHESSGSVNEAMQTLFLNTWVYSCGNFSFCTFQSGQAVMKTYFDWIFANLIDKKDKSKFPFPIIAPSIDYKKAGVDTLRIEKYFRKVGKPGILVCNNYSRNNQAYSDNLNFFVSRLANAFEGNIYLTNRVHPRLDRENIIYIEELLGLENKFSLNDISYFSTYCNAIIGRGSGPFTFCEVVHNLDKTWFSMTFPHVACDVFNGLHNYPNTGQFFHVQDEEFIMSELAKLFK